MLKARINHSIQFVVRSQCIFVSNRLFQKKHFAHPEACGGRRDGRDLPAKRNSQVDSMRLLDGFTVKISRALLILSMLEISSELPNP